MALTDAAYELCLPILDDYALDEEEKTDKLEELLKKETNLTSKALADAVLGALWRHRDAKNPPTVSYLARNSARLASPAPWQIPRVSTPTTSPSLTNASPVSSYGFGPIPPGLARAKSSTASPFTSPRPSPRLAYINPIPHSPNLNTYEFTEPHTPHTDYADLGSEDVDWLVEEAATSRPTSSGAGSFFESSLNAAAIPWVQPTQTDMSPYDMLRSIMGETKTDMEIEAALEANAYDLSATIASMMSRTEDTDVSSGTLQDGQILIGKSMQGPSAMSSDPKSSVICKYWLGTGTCLRADCRYSHEFGSTLCRYWMMGNCLAGDTCVFSHDPAQLLTDLTLNSGSTPSAGSPPVLQVKDYKSFPVLQQGGMNQWTIPPGNMSLSGTSPRMVTRSLSNTSFVSMQSGYGSAPSARSFSRPTSRHSSRAPTPSIPQVDDTEAFPSLGSPAGKTSKKHHGKRGGHGHAAVAKDASPSLLADIIKNNSVPNTPNSLRKGLVKSRSYAGRVEGSTVSTAIPPPDGIPWLETGERANQAYLKSRQDAFKHGGLRNKFLQSAAQAWNRNDARAAKALSLRGQSENDLMRKAHREAARILYEERSAASDRELYVDLHGLHAEDAVTYLEQILLEQQSTTRPVYIITGTSHHSKNGKDKVAKAIRQWLVEWKYTFREFSVPSDRGGNMGSILGIDATTFDKALLAKRSTTQNTSDTKPETAASISEDDSENAQMGPGKS